MDIISILYALITLCLIVGVIYLIFWVISQLGLTIPANVVKIVWIILVLLTIAWIVQHFFAGVNSGLGIHHR